MLTKVKGIRFDLSLMLLLALASTGLPRLYLDQSNALNSLVYPSDFFSKFLKSCLIDIRGKECAWRPRRIYENMRSASRSISRDCEKCGMSIL